MGLLGLEIISWDGVVNCYWVVEGGKVKGVIEFDYGRFWSLGSRIG